MSGWIVFANGIMSVVAAAFIAGVVLNPLVHEGIVIKMGLVLMIFGLLGTAAISLSESGNWAAAWNAGLVLRCGIVIVCAGVWWRHFNRSGT